MRLFRDETFAGIIQILLDQEVYIQYSSDQVSDLIPIVMPNRIYKSLPLFCILAIEF